MDNAGRFLPQELIRAKRDGNAWSDQEIHALVDGIVDGGLADEQLGAMAMAIYWRGLCREETTALTCAMRDSGRVMTWPTALSGPILDKHSTGGVGDATSLLIGPWLAACGAYVPMISGRGLGHTGGTLDKLAAIPGYTPFTDAERFQHTVQTVGVAIIGQTDDLAPADRRLYAVRDVTATVDCLPLIVASILSKKLAEGLDGLVLDVKTGSGAVLPNVTDAARLAETLVDVCCEAGTPAEALLTDMDQPLASCAGNALEVAEVLDLLTGQRSGGRLFDLSRELSARMLVQGGLAGSKGEALEKLNRVWAAGDVADRLARMVSALGGGDDVLERYREILPQAPVTVPVFAEKTGRIQAMDMRAIGLAVVALGGGRRHAADKIDPAVGLSDLLPVGASVDREHPLAVVHARNSNDAEQAARQLRAAVTIGEGEIKQQPLVLRRIARTS